MIEKIEKKTKPTAGPWEIVVRNKAGDLYVGSANKKRIAIVTSDPTVPPGIQEVAANAHLIAAAPALLLQLKQAHGIIRRLAKLARYYGYADEIPRLRETPRKAAIALAEKGAWL